MNAYEKAVERVARSLWWEEYQDGSFAYGLSEGDLDGWPCHDADDYRERARDILRALGLVAVDPALVVAARAADQRNEEAIGWWARLAIADAVLAQIAPPETKP